MTTIAWDGTTLAADTQSQSNGVKRVSHKITATQQYLYGMCGSEAEAMIVAKWVAGGCLPAEQPADLDTGPHGLLIERSTKKCFILDGERATMLPVVERFYAEGSGREYAMGAMYTGTNAAEAVSVASRFDIWTNDDIEHVDA